MFTEPERRRVIRVDVPRHVRGGELEPQFAHVLNLSLLGARVTHMTPLHEGVGCAVEFPPALGPLRTNNACRPVTTSPNEEDLS